MRTHLLMVFILLALGLFAAACGGEEATPVPSGVSADEVQRIVAEALAARSAAPNAAAVTELPFVIGVMDDLTGPARTYGNVAILVTGMIRIVKRDRQRIAKHRCRFVERNAMFFEIILCFVKIPFEFQHLSDLTSLVESPPTER